MPVSLVSLDLRGMRSYSPHEHKTQSIEFMPLTLIVGSNGSGKTTIIEALKFIISGEEPPLSDSRRNLLHSTHSSRASSFDSNVPYVSIKLKFLNARGELCLANRDITLPASNKNSTPSISSSYKIGRTPWKHVHRKDDWSKTMPVLFNIPNQAILNHVVMCHQEDNLWCLGDSSSVKQTFDKIFGCEQYKKEIKYIDAEIKSCKQDLAFAEKDLAYNREKKDRKLTLETELASAQQALEDNEKIVKATMEEQQKLEKQTSNVKARWASLEAELSSFQRVKYSLEPIQKECDSRKELLKTKFEQEPIDSMNVPDRELINQIADQQRVVDDWARKKREIERQRTKLCAEIDMLKGERVDIQLKRERNKGYRHNLTESISVKENYLKKVEERIEKANPLAKNLLTVADNLSEMSQIAKKIEQQELSVSLSRLINKSSEIIKDSISKVKDDDINKLKRELSSGNDEIEMSRKKLKTLADEANEEEKLADISAKIEEKLAESKLINTMDEESPDLLSESFKIRDINRLNLEYRKYLKSVNETKERLSKLGDETDLKSRIEALSKEHSELVLKYDIARKNHSMSLGVHTPLLQDVHRIKRELDKYRSANGFYARSLGTVICNQIVLSDLEKLKNCFAESVTNFHNQMICKINEVLKIRWRQIYVGGDIDYIELVAEVIPKSADKRSYNYYVAMCKNDIKMKMREKSSAGQKALAAIILKITLAELLIKDFAFIVLDEPTSNLDRNNIQSLATTIGNYVRKRAKRGANIQWIIITHDEYFLRTLDMECSPYYYKVKIDHEGTSQITKISSSED